MFVGGAYDPLKVFWKFFGNRAPEAHQIFFQLLKFGSASFGTIHRSVGLTGGHRRLNGSILSQNFNMLQF